MSIEEIDALLLGLPDIRTDYAAVLRDCGFGLHAARGVYLYRGPWRPDDLFGDPSRIVDVVPIGAHEDGRILGIGMNGSGDYLWLSNDGAEVAPAGIDDLAEFLKESEDGEPGATDNPDEAQ